MSKLAVEIATQQIIVRVKGSSIASRCPATETSPQCQQRTKQACEGTFSGDIIKKLRLVSVTLEHVDVQDNGERLKPIKGKARATVTVDLDVSDEMCNGGGNMHGGCTAFLLDFISSLPLIALSDLETWRTSGVSQNFNVFFLHAIPNGAKIRITTSSLSFGSRSAVTDCRFEDRATGKLLACGNHTKVDPFTGKKAKL